MDVKDFTELRIEKIQEIFDQGWNDIEFIEIVFREWSKINQKKLDTAQSVSSEIIEQAKKDSDRLIIELNDKFHKSSEIKKNSAKTKIAQMKDTAIKEIKNASVKIAIDSVKKIINTSVDKSKLDTLFQKNLDETKEELKKINS